MLSMFRQNSRPKLEFDRLLQRGAWRNGSARSSYCCKAVRLRLRVRYASLFPLKMVLDANHAIRVPWCSRIALFFSFFFPPWLSFASETFRDCCGGNGEGWARSDNFLGSFLGCRLSEAEQVFIYIFNSRFPSHCASLVVGKSKCLVQASVAARFW
jgi:hypothetical protein